MSDSPLDDQSPEEKSININTIQISNNKSPTADDYDRGKYTPSMTVLLLIGFVAFIAWASLFEIDRTVRAQGQIIPGARTQVIQAVDGGVLAELRVEEGQEVAVGEILAVLEKKRANANYEDNLVKVMSINAALIRAKAELDGIKPVYGDEFNDFPSFVESQLNFYQQRKQTLNDELNVLKLSLDIAKEELSINEALFEHGDVSRIEVMRSEQKVTEINREVTAVVNYYLNNANEEVAKLEAELASSRYKLEERQNVLNHTDLRSPVAGIVKYLRVNTLGGVLRSGDELMHISPTKDDMVIESKINPADIGQLETGMPVFISLDPFDYSIYGGLTGTLVYISSDTLSENVGNQAVTYYRAHLKLNDDAVELNPKFANVELKPGMNATVNIITGRRTILQYLLKPIKKGLSQAMTE